MIIDALRHIVPYETLGNFVQRGTSDNKNEPTLVNCSQLQAGTTLQQRALEQILNDDNWYLVFVKVGAYALQTISNGSFEIVVFLGETKVLLLIMVFLK